MRSLQGRVGLASGVEKTSIVQKGKGKGEGQVLDIALLHDEHMLTSQERFTISEVDSDWHELMIPQRIMRPSIAALANNWTRGAACRHTTYRPNQLH